MPEQLTSPAPLAAVTPLNGHVSTRDGAELAEITGLSLISLAITTGKESAFEKAVKKAWKIAVPPPGMSALTGNVRLIWTAPAQYHLLMPETGSQMLAAALEKTADTAWCTDQSDSYCMLRLSGPRARETLERICPLDLYPGSFAVNAAARTVMEHLGVLLICEKADQYLLLSARSSARSFLHAVETSLHNIA